MSKEVSSSLIPRLRFPQFRETWKSRLIGDLFDLSIASVKATIFESDKILTVKLHANGVVRNERTGTLTGGANYFKRSAGQFIFSKIDLLNGAFGVVPDDLDGFYSSTDVPAFTFKTGESPQFFLNWLTANYHRLEVERTGTSATLKRVSPEKFHAVPILLPLAAEQQKIAECLTSLDELIAAQGRKVEALKAHKRGLMQQLFPREGEAVPQLRFPEFRYAQEWESKVGGDLFTNRKEDGEEGLPIYSVTVNDGMVPRASFDRDFYDIEDPAGNKKVCKGDIAYNMMRMWQGAQGVAPEDCMVSPAYVVLTPRDGVCSDFFAYFFKLPQSLLLLSATSRGLTKDRLRLYFDDFARMRLCVPKFNEQKRIAACLSSLDVQITAASTKLDGLRTHKKGLMQQLFPAPAGESERQGASPRCLPSTERQEPLASANPLKNKPAASAAPLTVAKVSGRALAAGSSRENPTCDTGGQRPTAHRATVSGTALAAGESNVASQHKTPGASALPLKPNAIAAVPSRKPYPVGFARQLLAAEILLHCHQHPTMGRVKLQKLIHLCEYYSELEDIHGTYTRAAAGPFDNKLMRGIANGLEKKKWFKPVHDEKRTTYEPMEASGQHSKYLERWSEQLPKIREVIELFATLPTLNCEIASTLYAAWNDLLIDGEQPTDEEIVREASDPKRWHESKAKIEAFRWPKALQWMRQKGLVPRGYGAHTTKPKG